VACVAKKRSRSQRSATLPPDARASIVVAQLTDTEKTVGLRYQEKDNLPFAFPFSSRKTQCFDETASTANPPGIWRLGLLRLPAAFTDCRGLIATLAASILVICAGPRQAKASDNNPGAWPTPSTPAILPQPDPPFRGKISEYFTDSIPAWSKPSTPPRGAPNIVIILIDDAGFAATSGFGAPIETPALDHLATQGLRYNDFNVTAICSPTRAALLTGRNPHKVGFGTVTEVPSGYPGYNMLWKKSTASIAEVLRDNGYSTAAFGKWHNTPYWEISPVGPFDHWPIALGFQYFYGFMAGMDSEFEPRLYENTSPVSPSKTVDEGYYFTTDLADHAITWLHTHAALAPDRPYFMYFGTSATHQPQQVQREWITQYEGRFTEGWDKLRQEIFARQKALGVIPANTVLTSRPKEIPAWSSLSPAARHLEARQMAVYAGFMAETDHQIGRLLQAIEGSPNGSNTLIFCITGDNGASGEGGLEGVDQELWPETVAQQLKHIDRIGGPDFDNIYSAGWAWALDTPFKWMKQIASDAGGTRDPLILVWPERVKDHGGLRTQFTDVNDVVPTIYEVAGITSPTQVDGIDQLSLDGVSFAYTFDDPRAPSRHRVQYFETFGNRAIYDNGWLASARHGLPWSTPDRWKKTDFTHDPWRLYHVASDFSEAHDVAQQYPGRLAMLRTEFEAEARRNDVYPLGATYQTFLGSPSLERGRHEFVFYPSLTPIPVTALPIFSSRSRYQIRADLVVPTSGAQGVLLSYGSRLGGFVLYVKHGIPVYYNNNSLSHVIIASSAKLPSGTVRLRFDYIPNATRSNGTGTLYVNGSAVGTAVFTSMVGYYYGTLSIGRSFDSPVSAAYRGPFPFTGTVREVTISQR
jgi:arylsulfatase